jgi:acetyltransferase
MASMVRYHAIRSRRVGEIKSFGDVDNRKVEEILAHADRKNLSADDVYGILDAYGIPVANWQMATNPAEAVAAAESMGFPVVVKADAADVVHKSDMGAVAVDLADSQSVHAAVEQMQKKLDNDNLRFLVQQYRPGGMEVIMGAKAQAGLGHLIMFGLGGIYVEVLKDVVFNLTPITDLEAQEMLSSIKGAPLLKGVRAQKGVDRSRLVEIIMRLSQMVSDHPAIQEMDLNPVMAFENTAVVVDARISL